MCDACNPGLMRFLRAFGTRRETLKCLGAGLLAAGGCPAASAAPASTGAGGGVERIILSRSIVTMAPTASLTPIEAIAVAGGRIRALGRRADILGLAGPATEVVDLGDLTVLPGFIDPHMHSSFASLRPWLDVGPFTTRDMDEARAKIHAQAAATAPGKWVQAKMLDPSIMPGAPIDRTALDAIAPDVPVFVIESNGHVAYANSRAIAAAGLTRDTPNPPEARYIRHPDGELSGRLEETNAFEPFLKIMPTPSPQELVKLLNADWADASARGCTALNDCGIGALFGTGDLALLDTAMAGDPPLRYSGFLVSTLFDTWQKMGLRPGPRGPRFRLTGIKAWADGSNQAMTGYQRAPYLGTASRGALNYTPAQMEAAIREAHEAGWPVGIHANGQAAIDVTLDAYQRATGGEGGRRLRHRIEHCSVLDAGQIARMVDLGLSPSFLIGHVYYWGRAFRDRLLGPQRADLLDPCRSALAAGLRISLHSDYNVTPIDPLRCIENAVVRDMHEGGGVLNPDERITVTQAVRAMTLDAAWQCHMEDICGSLEVGKAADLVALEKNPFTVPPTDIATIRVHSTWLDGARRFSA